MFCGSRKRFFIAKSRVHGFTFRLILRGVSLHIGLGGEGVKLEAASGRGSPRPEDIHLRKHGGLVAVDDTQASHKQILSSLS